MKNNSSLDSDHLIHQANSSVLGPSHSSDHSPTIHSSSFLVTNTHPNFMSQHSSLMSSLDLNNKKSFKQIHQLYTQIHTTINDMDTKVEHVIKKHEAEFLFAYRSHIKKIKKQLSQIKYKSQEQEKMFSSNDRIQYLQQQLAIFRQQTMKIYKKLDQKNLEIDLLKLKLKDIQKQSSHNSSQLKEQIKKNKFQQMNKGNLLEKIQNLEYQLQQKNKQIQRLNDKNALNAQDGKNSGKAGSGYGQKSITLDHLKRFEYSKTSPFNSERKSPKNIINPSGLGTSAQFYIKSPQSPRVYETDLKQWFLECIKTVKRQIAQRNNNQKSLELNNISSIDEFMMIDKLRLLEIFLENQKLLTYMYERIFPDRLTNLRQKLNASKQTSSISNNSKEHLQLTTDRQERALSFNQEIISDRYKTHNKISYLPKVGKMSQQKSKLIDKSQWKGNVILKDGKLNISIL